MTTSVLNVAAFKPDVAGGVFYAPRGTALPSDATTALAGAYKRLGYVSNAGVQPARDVTIDKVNAWIGDVIAAIKNGDARSFTVVLVEVFQKDLNEFIYGGSNVTYVSASGSDGTTIDVEDTAYEIPGCIFGFDMVYNGARRRVALPNAMVAVTNENAWVANDVAGYELTIEAMKDDQGVRVYDFMQLDDAPGA